MTQRGNRRQATFFREFDFELYRQLLADQCQAAEVSLWAYCQLPNHVHLILVPTTQAGLAKALGGAHRRYTATINRREGWRGCLWQGRFASFAMDERHLHAAARYILLNPIRAGLVDRAVDWPHSSLRAHLGLKSDELVDMKGLGSRILDWPKFLLEGEAPSLFDRLRRHEANGAPLGDEEFLVDLEERTGRKLRPDFGWFQGGQRGSRITAHAVA